MEENSSTFPLSSATDPPAEESNWLDIIGSGGLKKKILKAGICESRPSKGDVVRIDAVGFLEDGTKVEEMKDFVFTVDGGELITGLDLIVKLMDKGEECRVFMESRFAYGEKGLEKTIPPNANLYYEVTLLDFKPEDEPSELDVDKRKEIGIRKREIGNWWFNRDDFDPAIKCYKSAIDFLDDTSDTLGEVIDPKLRELLEERLTTLNNMAAAQIKLEAYSMALKSLDSVLMCQPNNLKALYRKGKVLGILDKSSEGLTCLKKALEMDPNSKIILQEMNKLQKKVKADTESEKSLYRRMLGLKPNATKNLEEDRYPTLRGVPIKLFVVSFVTILLFLLILQYFASKYEFL